MLDDILLFGISLLTEYYFEISFYYSQLGKKGITMQSKYEFNENVVIIIFLLSNDVVLLFYY